MYTVTVGLKKGKAPNLVLNVSCKIIKIGAEKVVQQGSGDYTLEEDSCAAPAYPFFLFFLLPSLTHPQCR